VGEVHSLRYILVPVRALPRVEQAVPGAPDDAVSSVPRNGHDDAYDDGLQALAHWVSAARSSLDACLVVDAGGTVAGLSPTAAEMLGTAAHGLVGRPLDDVLNLIDFTDGAQEARGAARRIPPLIAVRENSLSRGMMRVRLPDGGRRMLDAVAAPIHDNDRRPIGAVSFLASV
jgi:PAS domain S-box-containing protein